MMGILSMWQPWASLVACGFKQNETRGFMPRYRGDVVIQASLGKKGLGEAKRLFALKGAPDIDPEALPRGKALCVVELYDVRSTHEIAQSLVTTKEEIAFGNYGSGRYAWRLRNLRQLRELPTLRGVQGLRQVSLATEEMIRSLIVEGAACP